MCICEHCGAINKEPEYVDYCLEDYNGVGDLFGTRTYGTYIVCPDCGSEEVEDYICDDDCRDCPYKDECEFEVRG